MAGKLEDKVALVTGASTGIRKSTAIAFAKEGAKVWPVTTKGRSRIVQDTLRTYLKEDQVPGTNVKKRKCWWPRVDWSISYYFGERCVLQYTNFSITGYDFFGSWWTLHTSDRPSIPASWTTSISLYDRYFRSRTRYARTSFAYVPWSFSDAWFFSVSLSDHRQNLYRSRMKNQEGHWGYCWCR